ncbi:hypothetical protein [Psychroserpens mesophilus]|uniref:hypothetical protein n=1 Tax=Psychroserpens mesophilus TaxID=325473 RepID=UPI003D646AA7
MIVRKFEAYVENLPNHIDLQYDDVDIQIFSGSLNLEQPLLTVKGQTTDSINAQIAFKTIKIKSLSYWDYVFNECINIQAIKVDEPEITYYHNKKVNNERYHSVLTNKLNKKINIASFEVSNAEIKIFKITNDSLIFSAEKLDFQLDSVVFNSSETKKLPFAFQNLSLSSENLKYNISEFENLFVASLNMNNQNTTLEEFELKTKYSKAELSKRIKTERDHFDLSIASVDIQNHNLKFDKTSSAHFEADSILINKPDFHIYRDKSITDDLVDKPLYSKMLRELNFDLTLSNVIINKAEITYEEKVKTDREPGRLEFSNLEATIKNISNTYSESERTSLNITSNFMKNTPLEVDWNFDVNDVNDNFVFKADIGMLKAEHLNQFMKPNLNLKLEGELIRTYFTIDGTANHSQIDLKTDYDQFDIVILKENGEEKNKFLSGLVNLFIAKDSNDKTDGFRHSDTKTVERDKTKSIFNFIWKNAQSGLVSAMAGDGKKDN